MRYRIMMKHAVSASMLHARPRPVEAHRRRQVPCSKKTAVRKQQPQQRQLLLQGQSPLLAPAAAGDAALAAAALSGGCGRPPAYRDFCHRKQKMNPQMSSPCCVPARCFEK